MVLDIATGATKVVMAGATRGWYIATGHLIYATETGAIYAVPFDPDRRDVTGSPVPVLDHVRSGLANGTRLTISPSGAISDLTGVTVQGLLQVVEVDRVAARLQFRPSVRVLERTPLFKWNPCSYGGQSSPAYDVSRDGQRFLVLKEPGAFRDVVAVLVLHWFEEVKQRMAAQGGRQP